ncbi:MAG: hypothetical protein Q8P84_01685 [Deltaproteobacteria bacterium]|nr:hypothetical protein [Deltaproteobacteria bacterium]
MGCEPRWIASGVINWLTSNPEETAYVSAYVSIQDLNAEMDTNTAEVVIDDDPSNGLTVEQNGYSFTLVSNGNDSYHWRDREGNDASWSSFYSAFAPTAVAFVSSRNGSLRMVYMETEVGVEAFKVFDSSL